MPIQRKAAQDREATAGQLGLDRAGRTEQDMACQGRVGYDREWWSRAGQPEELVQN